MPGNLLNASANKGNDVHNCFLSAFKEKYIQRLFLTYPLESSSRASRYSLQEEETYFDNFSTFADGVKQMKMTVTSPQLDGFFADRTYINNTLKNVDSTKWQIRRNNSN